MKMSVKSATPLVWREHSESKITKNIFMAFFNFSLSPRESVPTPTLVAACQPPVHGQVVQVQVGGGQTAGVGVVKHLQRRKAKIITRD